jgi:peptide/nickel transport system substrate-binding protein
MALALLVCLTLSLAGCSGGNDSDAQTDGVSIIAANDYDITSFDPHKSNDIASSTALRAVYDTLIYANEQLQFEPGLAESWEYTDDNTLRIKIAEGVKFHNGTPLTTEDVKFSIERQQKSGFVGDIVSSIESIEIVDDLTLDLKVTDASAGVIAGLAHAGAAILSKEHVEGLEAEGKSIDDDPVGTGPFIYESWTVGTEYTVKKNPDYFDENRAAKADRVTVRAMPEYNSQVVALQNGEIDISIFMSANNLTEIEADPSLTVVRYETTEETFAAFNCSKAPFDNVKLRQALNYTINRDNIIQVYMAGTGMPNYGVIGPSAVGYTGDVTKYEYDLDKAKALLAEAGYPDGLSFNLAVCTDYYAPAATVWQADLKKIGVDMTIEVMEVGAYYDMTGSAEHEVALSGWYGEPDPSTTFNPCFNSELIGKGGNNFACFKSDEIDSLLEQALIEKDMAKRLEFYYEISRIATENAVYAPMTSAEGFIILRDNISGVTPDLQGIIRLNGWTKS